MRPSSIIAPCLLIVTISCGDDASSDNPLPMGSGFADDESEAGEPTTSSITTGTTPVDGSTGEGWGGTAFSGELRAVLTVTFTADNALSDGDAVGLAGGYRTEEVGWVGSEDLYSPTVYQLAFPAPPEQADTLVPAQPVPVFDWGSMDDWRQAGNGMKLRLGTGGAELLACLLPAGNITGTYPLYRSSAAFDVAPACDPDPASWMPSTAYNVVLFGGELFEDVSLPNQVLTPAALVVTAPSLDAFDAPLAADQDLAISWEAGDDPEARIIIRVIDVDANVITVHAADDGSFTIPGTELSALTLGPIDLIVARERTDRVQFSDGGLTVLGRYERWGFFDLF